MTECHKCALLSNGWMQAFKTTTTEEANLQSDQVSPAKDMVSALVCQLMLQAVVLVQKECLEARESQETESVNDVYNELVSLYTFFDKIILQTGTGQTYPASQYERVNHIENLITKALTAAWQIQSSLDFRSKLQDIIQLKVAGLIGCLQQLKVSIISLRSDPSEFSRYLEDRQFWEQQGLGRMNFSSSIQKKFKAQEQERPFKKLYSCSGHLRAQIVLEKLRSMEGMCARASNPFSEADVQSIDSMLEETKTYWSFVKNEEKCELCDEKKLVDLRMLIETNFEAIRSQIELERERMVDEDEQGTQEESQNWIIVQTSKALTSRVEKYVALHCEQFSTQNKQKEESAVIPQTVSSQSCATKLLEGVLAKWQVPELAVSNTSYEPVSQDDLQQIMLKWQQYSLLSKCKVCMHPLNAFQCNVVSQQLQILKVEHALMLRIKCQRQIDVDFQRDICIQLKAKYSSVISKIRRIIKWCKLPSKQ